MFIRNLLTGFAGCGLLALAFVGFLIPILPGFLFLALALLCFASISPTVSRSLDRSPTWRVWHGHWRTSRGMRFSERIRLMFWMSADAAVRAVRPRRTR